MKVGNGKITTSIQLKKDVKCQVRDVQTSYDHSYRRYTDYPNINNRLLATTGPRLYYWARRPRQWIEPNLQIYFIQPISTPNNQM